MSERIAEIEARLAAATPGPWALNIDSTIDGPNYAEVICRGQVDCMSYCYGGTSTLDGDNLAADTEFIANAPEDVRHLLAELRKAQEALAAVPEAQARAYDKGYTHGRHDGELSHFGRAQRPSKSRKNPYRAAVATANGD